MEERTKIKIKNTAEQTGAAIGLTALALVVSALGPVTNTVVQAKKLTKKSKLHNDITMDDLKEALTSYATNFLPYNKQVLNTLLVDEMHKVVLRGRDRLKAYDNKIIEAADKLRQKQEKESAITPHALQQSDVSQILSLIDSTHTIEIIGPYKSEAHKLYNELKIPTEKTIGGYIETTLPKFIAKIGNVYLPIDHPSMSVAYIKTSNGKIKSMPYPKLQQSIIVQHLIARQDELKHISEKQNKDDFTAAIMAQKLQRA